MTRLLLATLLLTACGKPGGCEAYGYVRRIDHAGQCLDPRNGAIHDLRYLESEHGR